MVVIMMRRSRKACFNKIFHTTLQNPTSHKLYISNLIFIDAATTFFVLQFIVNDAKIVFPSHLLCANLRSLIGSILQSKIRAASLQQSANLVAAYMDNTAMGSRQFGMNNQTCTLAECSTLLTLALFTQISKHFLLSGIST